MTTIEQYLQAILPDANFTTIALEKFANSPADVGLMPLYLSENAYPVPFDAEFMKRRQYAESSLWYSAVGLFSGGSESEKIGDESYSKGGYVITEKDRDRFIAMANKLRVCSGFDIEIIFSDSEVTDAQELIGLVL